MTEEDEDKDDDRDDELEDELEDEDEDDPAPVLGVFVGLCVCDFPPPLLEGVGVLGVVRLGGIAAAEFYRRRDPSIEFSAYSIVCTVWQIRNPKSGNLERKCLSMGNL